MYICQRVGESVSTITLSLSRGVVEVYASMSLVLVFNVFLPYGEYHYFFYVTKHLRSFHAERLQDKHID